jgi:hypothetical protein
MWLVTKVETKQWDLIVYFNDGVVKKVDIREYLKDASSPSVNRIKTDMAFFHKVENEDGVSLTWPTGFCIDPDFIHDEGESIQYAASSLISALNKIIKK